MNPKKKSEMTQIGDFADLDNLSKTSSKGFCSCFVAYRKGRKVAIEGS